MHPVVIAFSGYSQYTFTAMEDLDMKFEGMAIIE